LQANFNQVFTQPGTYFIVWNITGPTGLPQVLFAGLDVTNSQSLQYWTADGKLYASGGASLTLAKLIPFNYLMHTFVINGSSSEFYENSALKVTGNCGVNGIGGLTIGASSSFLNALKGDIAEIIYYNSNLINQNRLTVENYLKYKYFPDLFIPPVNLGQDIHVSYGFCDTTIVGPAGYSSYLWSTGDTTASISVNTPGTYWLEVKDILGYVSRDSIEVFYPNYKINDTLICYGDSINFSLGLSNNYSFLWSTGETTPNIYIGEAGTYWVRVNNTLGSVCFKTDTFHVALDSLAHFLSLGTEASLCIGNKIFVATGNSYASSYLWTPTNDITPQTIINQPGWYVLQATSPNQCIAKDSVYAPASGTVPNIHYSVTGSCVNDSIHFTDLSQSITAINYWHWDIGNQYNSGLSNPVIKFDTSGLYPLTLTVANTSACYKDTTAFVQIKPGPHSNIMFYPACEGIETTFDDNSFIPQGYNLTSRQWYIDGLPLNNQTTLFHTFNATGTYTVRLEIAIDNLCNDYSEIQTTVQNIYPSPQNFTLVSPPDSITIYNNSCNFMWNPAPNAVKYKLVLATDSTFTNIINQSDFIYSFSAFTPPPISYFLSLPVSTPFTPIYWKVNAYNPCNDSTSSNTQIFYPFNPSQISGLKFWVKSDAGVLLDNNGAVSQWNDLSGNNFNTIQGNANKRPIKVNSQINGYPVIRFDGINDYLQVNFGTVITQPATYFVVWNISGSTGNPQALFTGIDGTNVHVIQYWAADSKLYAGGGTSLSYTKVIPFNYLMHTFVINGLSSALYENSILKVSGNGGANGIGGLTIGANSSFSNVLKGDIAEIIFYNALLPDTQRTMVEHYIMDKYAPPVNLGPDIYMHNTVCDTTLKAGSDYTSYTWSTGATTPSISVINSGTYWVSVTDIFGRISSDTVVVVKPAFSLHDTLICIGAPLVMNPGGGSAYNYLWSTGETTQSVAIHNQGNYWVDISDHECHKNLSFSVTTDNYEHTATLGPDKAICSGETIGLLSNNAETVTYHWNTGDTTSTINITSAGQYILEAENIRGCNMLDTINVTLNGFLPVADFIADSVCVGAMMNFTDMSSSNINDTVSYWFWNFGNYNYAYQQNPYKTFLTPGIHNVTLIVHTISTNNCSDTITKPVLVYDKPVINFTPNNGCKGVPIEFHESSTLTYGTVNSWQWTFGDGSASVLQSPLHTYATDGYYDVKLISKSTHNCVDSLKDSINIKSGPVVDFVNSNACFGQDIQFTNKTLSTPWTDIIEQSWDFGDGDQSVLINPDHVFIDSAGTYNVSLTEKSINGCIITKTKPVKVHEIPNAFFAAGNACANVPFQFFDASTVVDDTIAHWLWNFDNLGTDSIKNPLFSFPSQGVYTVNLNITTTGGCKNYISSDIEVYPSPTASFTFTPHFGISPLTVYFTNYSTPSESLTYQWNFGDNTGQSSLTNPSYTYTQNGIYTVELTAINSLGCQNSASDIVNVIPTIIDIAVDKVNVEIVDDYVKVTATIKNIGTQTLYKFDLIATGSNGITFRELWQGVLLPNQTIDYTLSAQFLINDQKLDYVCVKAVTLELENDVDLSNNENCKAVTNDFTVTNIFPNPSTQEVNLSTIIPSDDIVEISLYNTNGELIANIYNGLLPEGLNRFKVNIESLRKGIYSFVVNYHDKQIVAKFVKF